MPQEPSLYTASAPTLEYRNYDNTRAYATFKDGVLTIPYADTTVHGICVEQRQKDYSPVTVCVPRATLGSDQMRTGEVAALAILTGILILLLCLVTTKKVSR
jgi:hypothetical protein